MKYNVDKNEISLEDQLFNHALYFGTTVIALLLVYDSLFSRDYLSVFIELAAGIVFIINFFMVGKHQVSKRHRHIFSIVIVIIMDLGWITGGGISLLMASINFLVLGFILVVNDSRFYRIIFLLFFINYVFLFIVEYVYHFNLLEGFEPINLI